MRLVDRGQADVVAVELAAGGPSNSVGAGMELPVTRTCPKWARSELPDRLKSEEPVVSSLPYWRS
jgi:hypothetical protein